MRTGVGSAFALETSRRKAEIARVLMERVQPIESTGQQLRTPQWKAMAGPRIADGPRL